jgi:RNA polymerase sigma-70 factor (ECF subfamily)
MFRPATAMGIPLADTSTTDPRPSPAEDEVIRLFEQLRVPVLRYLLSCRVPVPDAEEILQEVFILLFQDLRRGKSSVNLAGWVFRTAHHFVLKYRDRIRRHAEHFNISHDGAEAIADSSAGVDVALAQTQRQKSLLAVVRALPEQDQRCLHLRAEGLRYREIAETLGMSLGSVANSLERSIARIARADER